MKGRFFVLALIFSFNTLWGAHFFVDPVLGDDNGDGSKENPWKSFAPVNQMELLGGDVLEILQAGPLTKTLMPKCSGSAQNPVTIRFAPGRYDIFPDELWAQKFAISNTNDDPNGLKKAAIFLKACEGVRLVGKDSYLFMRGKMLELVVQQCYHVSINGLHFDYERPTTSELKITEKRGNRLIAQVAADSDYEIRHGKLFWIGEGWEMKAAGYYQELSAETDCLKRAGMDFLQGIRVKELKPNCLELRGLGIDRYKVGNTYQNREIFRDYCSIFIDRSQNIKFFNCGIHYLHGMGVVSQFSSNLTFYKIDMTPRKESDRTVAAWADFLHFSGCKGQIRIEEVQFLGANDDSVNVHGTHLKVTDIDLEEQTATVRFMHPQTYGFQPFYPGDRVAFINSSTLLPIGEAIVGQAEALSEKEWLLTFKRRPPALNIKANIYLENVTWSPDVIIKNCYTKHAPTRAFLLTTRGKVLVEGNRIEGTGMTGILISDDANYWYESSMVQDVTIRNNEFINCFQPNITILPECRSLVSDQWVHHNIRILDNQFNGIESNKTVIFAKSVKGLQLQGEKVKTELIHCSEVSDEMQGE